MWTRLPSCRRVQLSGALRRSTLHGLATQDPKLVIVDGRRSVELVRAELALSVKVHASRGVELFAAGRQGVAVALRATAQVQLHGRRPLAFTLASASAAELAEAGLEPPDHAAAPARDVTDSGNDIPGQERRGLRLSFRAHRTTTAERGTRMPDEEELSASEEDITKVLTVGQSSRFLPLAKAIATNVARLPDGRIVAVETALRGKAKNTWTRTYLMAQAVAQAHQWQVAPANETLVARPFQCIVKEVVKETEGADADGTHAKDFQVLRLLLLPLVKPSFASQSVPSTGIRNHIQSPLS